ncbi:LysM peptidoglycan-binding domain-containing protein [Flavobacteriaceae bacterium TK19130]|nr:LysM peptidoglycan-binding domain-containing protein [Thermobacterium salinum]
MTKYLLLVAFTCIVGLGCGTVSQQQQQLPKYNSHTVQKGETVFRIAQRYNIDERDIYRLNPDARNGIDENMVLILPARVDDANSDVTFKIHRVKRKETLFSISQQYSVSQADIKKYNKELYARQLKKGEKIRIPVSEKNTGTVVIPDTSSNTETSDTGKHTVAPKETKYGIARKYGITVAELEAMNPDVGESLPIGTVLNVPEKSVSDSAVIDTDRYEVYEVKPKEGFFRLKVKFGLTKEEIVALNPHAADGLKEGMVLKLPKSDTTLSEAVTRVDLENAIVNRSEKRLAIMLPFRLNRAVSDSLEAKKELLKSSNTLQVALDFYSGVLMAAEFAKDKGIPVRLDVYDTEGSSSKISSLLSSQNFSGVDAVIGPLIRSNVERAAAELRSKDIPVFSPLTNRDVSRYENLFQTLPEEKLLRDRMLSYLSDNSLGKNIIIVSDGGKVNEKNAIMAKLPNAKTVSPREGGYLYPQDIASKINTETENWVILASKDPVLVSNVVGLLNGMPDKHRLRLFTLDKNDAYDYHDVSSRHLAKLNFTFPSVHKSYNYKEKLPFLVSYKNEYGVLPNKYAVRGFDLTYDVLLRLASAEDLYEATNQEFTTEYIENKFRYQRDTSSGYQNLATYLIRYTADLQFEEVK